MRNKWIYVCVYTESIKQGLNKSLIHIYYSLLSNNQDLESKVIWLRYFHIMNNFVYK